MELAPGADIAVCVTWEPLGRPTIVAVVQPAHFRCHDDRAKP